MITWKVTVSRISLKTLEIQAQSSIPARLGKLQLHGKVIVSWIPSKTLEIQAKTSIPARPEKSQFIAGAVDALGICKDSQGEPMKTLGNKGVRPWRPRISASTIKVHFQQHGSVIVSWISVKNVGNTSIPCIERRARHRMPGKSRGRINSFIPPLAF